MFENIPMLKYKSFIHKMLNRVGFTHILFAVTAAIALLVTCIQRNNPFDPIFTKTEVANGCSLDSSLYKTFMADAKNVVVKTGALATQAQLFSDTLTSDSLRNQISIDSNKNISIKNQLTIMRNLTIDSANRKQPSVDSLQFKFTLTPVSSPDSFPFFGYTAAYRQFDTLLQKLYADFIFACPNNAVRIQSFIDSQKTQTALSYSTIESIGGRFNALSRTLNDAVIANYLYNHVVELMNDTISRYNDSLQFLKRVQRYTQIKTVADLQNSIRLAQPGDTLALLQKNFIISSGGISGLGNSGTIDRPIVVMGNPRDTTVITTQSGVVLSNNNYFNFCNLTFSGSINSGFKVTQSDGVKLVNCVFVNNKIHGIEILDSKIIQMTDCRILRNGVDGIRVSTQTGIINNLLYLTNALIAKNGSHGIEVVNTNINARNLTVSNNGKSGLLISDPSQNVSIAQSLVTFNGAFGVSFPLQGEPLSIDNTTDIFGNGAGPISIDGITVFDYRKVNPPYTDTANGDFSIAPGGIIDSLQQQPWQIIIGYRGK